MYIVSLNYVKPLEDVEKYLEAHVAFLDKYYESGNFIASGRKNPRTGGIILCNAESEDELNTILAEDPFSRNAIAEYEVTEFFPSKFAEGFEAFVEQKIS
ncbi:YciI family protein [Streptococcus devriesei]|uniref:YciI family protein n=1 Tax=Streptococcus devriesei TaxID=231233 RepID=UPI0003F8F88D|nr:YciI family protein [Streptococcus devriesei]